MQLHDLCLWGLSSLGGAVGLKLLLICRNRKHNLSTDTKSSRDNTWISVTCPRLPLQKDTAEKHRMRTKAVIPPQTKTRSSVRIWHRASGLFSEADMEET